MNFYLGICMTAFAAGIGWYAARFLWELLEGFIIDDEEEHYDRRF